MRYSGCVLSISEASFWLHLALQVSCMQRMSCSLYYTHPRCPHSIMIFTIKQEAMGVISALINILGTELLSPLAPELLLGQFSGWV